MKYEQIIQDLIDQFQKLPSIGPKSAERLAFFVLEQPPEIANQLSRSLQQSRQQIRRCSVCYNFSVDEICYICANPNRNDSQILVVANPQDLLAIDRSAEFQGKYHVLGGVLDPLTNITPDKLSITQLKKRTQDPAVQEVILALNTSVEGEATALFISNAIARTGLKITKLGLGIPVGADIEYADEQTISQSLKNRTE
jgi:recombination protein RecR